MKSNFLLAILIVLFSFTTASSQSTIRKKINVTVTDASGKPVQGAEVTYKGLLSKQKKITDQTGKVTIEIALISSMLNATIEVNDTKNPAEFKPYKTTVTLRDNQEVYEVPAPVINLFKRITITVVDANTQPVPNAKITVKNTNEIIQTTTDGKATLNVAVDGPALIPVIITKDGYQAFTMNVDANSPGIINSVLEKNKTTAMYDMAGPTSNVINTAVPPDTRIPVNTNPPHVWGPYTPTCATDPVAAVPEFSSFFVQDNKDLLDYVSESCIGAAGNAVNSLADLSLNVASVTSQFQSLWFSENTPSTGQAAMATKKLYDDNKEKLKKAANDAYTKTKTLYENMLKLAGGPELYVMNCLWSGIKKYAGDQLPEDLQAMKKATESFDKAKIAMEKKLDSLQKWIAAGTPAPKNEQEKKLFTQWNEISSNIQTTTNGLNMIVTYMWDPIKALPYDIQLATAVNSIEGMIGSLMTDCQIINTDQRIKDGISAGQKALLAARKNYAQLRKNELKWKEKIYQQTGNYDFTRVNYDPGVPYWDQWKKFETERIKAEQKRDELSNMLAKLGEFCVRLGPIAVTLNERVNKYELLFSKGIDAATACKFNEAQNFLKELQQLENSACGHFFPKPYGKTKSEELNDKIKIARIEGPCRQNLPGGEKMYGPYTITPGAWLPTGLSLKKGQSFRVEASGILRYKDPPNIQNTPDGGGYWGWWQLKAKINEQIIGVGSKGGGTAANDGKLELGAPATYTMGHAEEKALEGSYTVYIYSRTAVEDKTTNKPASTSQSGSNKIEEVSEKNFEKITGIPSSYGVFNLIESGIKSTGMAVLGKFPDYIKTAQQLNASVFTLGNKFEELQRDGYDPWKANLYFLDRIADLKQKITIELGGKKLDGYLANEVQYMIEKRGYKWADNGKTLIPSNQ